MKSSKSPQPFSTDPTGAASMLSQPINPPLTASRFLKVVGPCAAILAAVLVIAPWIGSASISVRGVYSGVATDWEIFTVARLPRIMFAALAGGALAVAGVLFQALLRNSLATPFTLGISAGSSFGAVVAISLGLNRVLLGIPVISVFAFLGAFLTIGLVFYISRSQGVLPTFTLLLAGVTLNFVFGALTLLSWAGDTYIAGALVQPTSRWATSLVAIPVALLALL